MYILYTFKDLASLEWYPFLAFRVYGPFLITCQLKADTHSLAHSLTCTQSCNLTAAAFLSLVLK